MIKEKQEDRGRVRYNIVELVIQLLQTKYEIHLSISYFFTAIDFLANKAKASIFITLNGQIQDI